MSVDEQPDFYKPTLNFDQSEHERDEANCVCTICDYICKTKTNMLDHRKLRHRETLEIFRCSKCEFETFIEEDLETHLKCCFINCKNCDFICLTTNAMKLKKNLTFKIFCLSGLSMF